MQFPGENDDTSTGISLAAMGVLFDQQPHSSVSLQGTPMFPSTRPSKPNIHNRSISLGSASSLLEGTQQPVNALPSVQHYSDSVMRARAQLPTSHSSPGESYPSKSKKRTYDDISEDEAQSSEVEAPGANATEEEKKAYKRRLNTRAARRSRKKRSLETQSLRDENAKLKTENAIWKERARMLERLLATHGIPCPSIPR